MVTDMQADAIVKDNVDRYVDMCQQFDDTIETLTDERGAHYGHPLDDFARNTVVDDALAQCKDPQVRHALRMVWVKVCRLIETPDHADSVADIAGYARTIAMIHDERKRRAQSHD